MINDTLTALDIALPAGVAHAQGLHQEAMRLANSQPYAARPGDHDDPADVAAAFAKAAEAQAVKEYAQRVHVDYERHATNVTARAYRAEVDRLFTDLATRFDKAATVVAKAATVIAPSDTAETILARGDDAAKLWRSLTATSDLDLVSDAVAALSKYTVAGAGEGPLWYIDVDDHHGFAELDEAWQAARRHAGPGGRWLVLAHAGYTLALATGQDKADRVAKINAARNEEIRQFNDAKRRTDPGYKSDRALLLDQQTRTLA